MQLALEQAEVLSDRGRRCIARGFRILDARRRVRGEFVPVSPPVPLHFSEALTLRSTNGNIAGIVG
jgi:hypothetical protein